MAEVAPEGSGGADRNIFIIVGGLTALLALGLIALGAFLILPGLFGGNRTPVAENPTQTPWIIYIPVTVTPEPLTATPLPTVTSSKPTPEPINTLVVFVTATTGPTATPSPTITPAPTNSPIPPSKTPTRLPPTPQPPTIVTTPTATSVIIIVTSTPEPTPFAGSLSFDYPLQLTVGKDDTVSVEILPDRPVAFIPNPNLPGGVLLVESNPTGGPHKTVPYRIQIYPVMSAELTAGSAEAIVITAAKESTQDVDPLQKTFWTWGVVAKKPGDHGVTLRVFGMLERIPN